jgi:hypothetical protein
MAKREVPQQNRDDVFEQSGLPLICAPKPWYLDLDKGGIQKEQIDTHKLDNSKARTSLIGGLVDRETGSFVDWP